MLCSRSSCTTLTAAPAAVPASSLRAPLDYSMLCIPQGEPVRSRGCRRAAQRCTPAQDSGRSVATRRGNFCAKTCAGLGRERTQRTHVEACRRARLAPSRTAPPHWPHTHHDRDSLRSSLRSRLRPLHAYAPHPCTRAPLQRPAPVRTTALPPRRAPPCALANRHFPLPQPFSQPFQPTPANSPAGHASVP